jgi:hypothetical protein
MSECQADPATRKKAERQGRPAPKLIENTLTSDMSDLNLYANMIPNLETSMADGHKPMQL